eukprot:scaffold107_cov106-Isochrysis_galbana.AAC.6
MAASAAATEVAYLREIFRDLGLCQTDPTELYVDNTGAEMLAKERKVTSRSRHILPVVISKCGSTWLTALLMFAAFLPMTILRIFSPSPSLGLPSAAIATPFLMFELRGLSAFGSVP